MNEHENTKALVLDTAEQEKLGEEVSLIEQQVSAVEIRNDNEYAAAGELTRQVKTMQKNVNDYWEPMRVSTYEAYKSVTDHKKEMLTPLEKAEKILKSKMADYTMEQERKRREQEEAMRRLAQAETEKKLNEAIEAEKAGDTEKAEAAMTEAEVMQSVAVGGMIPSQAPKAAGVSQSKTWAIKSIDASKVPVEIFGAVLRPVDEKAVLALIKATKGTIQIPGVEYEQTVSISIRT